MEFKFIKFVVSHKQTSIFVLVGFIVSMYIVYIRLIWERPSRPLFQDITEIQLWIYFDLFMIFGGLSLTYMYFWYREKYPKKRKLANPWIIYFITKIKFYVIYIGLYTSMLYENSLKYFDYFIREVIIEKFLKLSTTLTISRSYLKLFSYSKKFQTQHEIAIIVFTIIPKLLMLIILAIDIFIYKEIAYFYLAAPIYLIPLIWEYYIYIVKLWASEINSMQCQTQIYLDPDTDKIVTHQERMEMAARCLVPHRGKYILLVGVDKKITEKIYNKLSNLYFNFTKPVLEEMYAANYSEEQISFLLDETIKTNKTVMDTLLILNIYNRTKTHYKKKFKIDKLIVMGYAICWGYVFFYSLYIYFI